MQASTEFCAFPCSILFALPELSDDALEAFLILLAAALGRFSDGSLQYTQIHSLPSCSISWPIAFVTFTHFPWYLKFQFSNFQTKQSLSHFFTTPRRCHSRSWNGCCEAGCTRTTACPGRPPICLPRSRNCLARFRTRGRRLEVCGSAYNLNVVSRDATNIRLLFNFRLFGHFFNIRYSK